MASLEQTRRAAMRGAASFFGALSVGLRELGQQRAGAWADAPARPLVEQSELFARACAENSNRAMDWLYYAAQLKGDERRYCIEQALTLGSDDPVILAEARRLR